MNEHPLMTIVYGDITNLKADVIVNAANGIGFMGGLIGRFIRLPGVAESIHYRTKGLVEKESKRKSRKSKWIPSVLWGHKTGELYVTGAGSLPAYWIIHAVTMKYPGMRASLRTVEKLLPLIIQEAKLLNARTIAIPLLGTGTGGLKEDEVLALYKAVFSKEDLLDIQIVLYAKEKGKYDDNSIY